MKPPLRNLALAFSLSILSTLASGCVGYRLGGNKPDKLSDIHTIEVPLFKNNTQFPRLAVLATNTCVDAFVDDGTYRVASRNSDATLHASIESITYRQVRSATNDVLASEELELQLLINWNLKKANRILESGTSRGVTRFFVAENLQTARANVMADAVSRATRSIVLRLADGF